MGFIFSIFYLMSIESYVSDLRMIVVSYGKMAHLIGIWTHERGEKSYKRTIYLLFFYHYISFYAIFFF